jgi:broad specificity phosphatase PhoE
MVKIYLMRHAESLYNEEAQQIKNSCSDRLITMDGEEKKLQNLRMSTAKDILNARLSERGITQVQKLMAEGTYKKIKYVVLSPLRRCLETFEYLFEDRISKNPDAVKVFIVPELREVISNSGDIAFWLKNEFESLRFPHFYNLVTNFCFTPKGADEKSP